MSECSAVSRLQNIFISAWLILSVDEHAIYLPGCKLVHGPWSSAPDILEEFFIKLHLVLQHWFFSFFRHSFSGALPYIRMHGSVSTLFSMILTPVSESSVKLISSGLAGNSHSMN